MGTSETHSTLEPALSSAMPPLSVTAPSQVHERIAAIEARAAGTVLLCGGILFLAGAAYPSFAGFSPEMDVHLRAVAGQRWRWLWNAAGQGLGCLVTLFGYVLLTLRLRHTRQLPLCALALTGLIIGTGLFTVSMSFRLFVSDWAAGQFAATEVVPSGYGALRSWSGSLFAVYMELAYLALVAFGVGLRDAPIIAPWAGRTALGIGVFGAVLFPIPGIGAAVAPPLIPHLAAVLLGTSLVRTHNAERHVELSMRAK